MLPEFEFDHCIYQLSEQTLTEDGLVYGFAKAATLLRLKQRPDIGLTVIISPKWMMVAILTQPYTKSNAGFPAYLDGFAFSGLVNIQTREKDWPETAGLEVSTLSVMEALHLSTEVLTVKPKVVVPSELEKPVASPEKDE